MTTKGLDLETQLKSWMNPGKRSAQKVEEPGESLGTFAMQAVCPFEKPLHLWIWHVLPVMALAVGGALVAEPLLRWRGERNS